MGGSWPPKGKYRCPQGVGSWTKVWLQTPCVSQIGNIPVPPPSCALLQPHLHDWPWTCQGPEGTNSLSWPGAFTHTPAHSPFKGLQLLCEQHQVSASVFWVDLGPLL